MIESQIVNTLTGEVVSLQESKNFMRVDTDADNFLITRMIEQSRIVLENYLSADIVPKERKMYYPIVNELVYLPFSPVNTIDSVTVNGSSATYESKGVGNNIVSLSETPANEVLITYKTKGLNNVLIKQTILQMTSTLYDQRNDFVTGTIVAEVPTTAKSLLPSQKNMFI